MFSRSFIAAACVAAVSLGGAAQACSIAGIADGPPRDGGGSAEATTTDGARGEPCAADLAKDPKNCGRCGRVCAGLCDEGTCDVSVVISGQPAPTSLGTNGRYVVWGSPKSLRACPVDGCPTPMTLMELDLTGQIAVDGDDVFYTTGRTSSQGVNHCPIANCGAQDQNMGFDLGEPAALAVDQGEVYVLETKGRRVLHDSLTGGADNTEVARNTPADGAIGLALSKFYWSTLGSGGAMYSCPRTGCVSGVPETFAGGQSNVRALTVDRDGVRWTRFDDGVVASCPLGGCAGAPQVLAQGQKNPLGIASDGTRVYWANEGDGTIVTCPTSGCAGAPEIVARALDRPQWVTLDATHVYFATASGVIGRTPK